MEVIQIQDQSHIGEARRLAKNMAERLGLTPVQIEKVALIVNETGSNILKHAHHGKLILRPLIKGVEMMALDQGNGIPNLHQAMQDGYSTAGSQGIGMGAVARLSDMFDIYTLPGKGTIVLTRLWCEKPTPSEAYEVIALPKAGEVVNGDGWAIVYPSGKSLFMLVDGLGHGPEAHAVAKQAVASLSQHRYTTPEAAMQQLHQALAGTRGAALALAEVDSRQQTVHFVGVGNIHAVLLTDESKGQVMISSNGIVGFQMREVQKYTYTWQGRSQPKLIMHSDGLNTRWHMNEYPGLLHKPLSIIAAVLYRDFNRDYDDVTVMVANLE